LNRQQLIHEIRNLQSDYPDEMAFQGLFDELLQHPRAYHRDHLPGHITGSAWIVNKDYSRVLLVLHGKLRRWLQPGGHADGDENVLDVALREAREETGVQNFSLPYSTFFDLDIHPIPDRKDFPAHLHYDIRFLAIASDKDPLQISDESVDLKWFDLQDLEKVTGNAPSVMRMADKMIKIREKAG
jgi:8-oxo-dGTP pyrophosphatase MutT (NUDIX family)